MHLDFRKTLHILLNIIICIGILIVILVGYNYVQLQILHKNYTNFLGYTIFEISTGSMKDALDIYDVVVVKITKDVNEDDIISYQEGNEIITHRVLKINGEEITTRGDANNTEDKTITKDNVIGKVIYVCEKTGIWVRVFSEPYILISICITFILIGKSIENGNNREKQQGYTRKRRREKVE